MIHNHLIFSFWNYKEVLKLWLSPKLCDSSSIIVNLLYYIDQVRLVGTGYVIYSHTVCSQNVSKNHVTLLYSYKQTTLVMKQSYTNKIKFAVSISPSRHSFSCFVQYNPVFKSMVFWEILLLQQFLRSYHFQRNRIVYIFMRGLHFILDLHNFTTANQLMLLFRDILT